MRIRLSLALVVVALALATGCSQAKPADSGSAPAEPAAAPSPKPLNIYSATTVGNLSPEAAKALPLVYVPNLKSNSVTVIDPVTHEVLRTIPVGQGPQHVVPSHDMSRLWVTNNSGNSLTPIDPVTGLAGKAVPVDDPYNLYFTPDGTSAMVIAEALERIDFRDPVTMKLQKSLRVTCAGLDHVDFTADEKYAIASCEFSAQLVKVDMTTREVVGYLKLEEGSMPQDIRVSPDGKRFYAADMAKGGMHVVDPDTFKEIDFIKTGLGAHGFVVGREGKVFYIANRGWGAMTSGKRGPGSVTMFDPLTGSIKANWPIPGGGSPDMGNVTADGKELWFSGRYDSEVYVLNAETGALIARVAVGKEPHGLCVWPQPGRISLGHTGNMR